MFNPLNSITKYLTQGPRPVAIDIFIKFELVKSAAEGEELLRIVSSKKVDSRSEFLAHEFANALEHQLSNKAPLNDKELTVVFETLLGLVQCSGYQNFEFLALPFFGCFECTSRYNYKTKDDPLTLPLEIHEKAFAVCKSIIIKDQVETKFIVKTLPHTLNHPSLSVDQQMELIPLLRYIDEEKIRLLQRCVTLEHATPFFRAAVAEMLFAIVLDKQQPADDRKMIMEQLPFLSEYLNIEQSLREKSVRVLVHLIEDKNEGANIQKNAVKNLSIWTWSTLDNQVHLEYIRQQALHFLLQTINDSHPQALVAAKWLFYRMGAAKATDPTLRYLFDPYKEMLCDEDIPMSIKFELARNMPKGSPNFCPEQPGAIRLFFFMLGKIKDENYPIELKRIFVHHLVLCYFYPTTCKLIGEIDDTIDSIYGFLDLEVFSLNEELKAVSQEAYRVLAAGQAEQASRWASGGMIIKIPLSKF